MSSTTMPISRHDGGWWIDDEGFDTGPYDTRHEAEEARRGLRRYYKHENRRGFVTGERRDNKRPRAKTRSR